MTIDPTEFTSIEDTAEFAEYEQNEAEVAALVEAGEMGRPVAVPVQTVEQDDINF